jgi:hypothetical protein
VLKDNKEIKKSITHYTGTISIPNPRLKTIDETC